MSRAVLEALAVWAASSVVLYASYEILQRTFWDALPAEAQRLDTLVRAAAVSATATIVTTLYTMWRRVPQAPDLAAQVAPGIATRGSTELSAWLLGLRWVALLLSAMALSASATAPGQTFVATRGTLPLWLTVAVVFAFNAALTLAGSRRAAMRWVLSLQTAVDVAALGVALHFTGGISNPFAMFLVFPGVLAAMTHGTDAARRVAVAIAAFVLLMSVLEATGAFPASCTHHASALCTSLTPVRIVCGGLAVATTTIACTSFVSAAIGQLRLERVRAEQATAALALERETIASVVDCMADAVLFADTEGRVRLHNHAAASLWRNAESVAPDLRVCHAHAPWARILNKIADPQPVEAHPMLTIDGRTYEATYAPVRASSGELCGVVMVARDATERQRAETWRMNEERLAVVGKLSATLAHELNNPLASIALFTRHALKRTQPNEQLHDHLLTVLRNADQCTKIVRELLDYARQRPPEQRAFELAETLDHVARTLTRAAEDARVTVRVTRPEVTTVLGDPGQMTQVFMNLGLNAIEAMSDGGELAFCVTRDDAGGLEVAVSDTGPGISDAMRAQIFSAFFTTKARGTGLGLTVAHDIVHAHGGALVLTEAASAGTCFVVRLPAPGSSLERKALT